MTATTTTASPPIVDSQVHLNLLGTLEAGIAAMDAVGVDAAVVDDWWGFDSNFIRLPHYKLADGTIRSMYPFASDAAYRYPDRIAYAAWLDRDDPSLDELVAGISQNPHQLCIRVVLRTELGDDVAIESGGYDRLLRAAERHSIPVMVRPGTLDLPKRVDIMVPVIRRFEGLQFVIDHCGVLLLSDADIARGMNNPTALEYALPYARLPNVAIKWSHAPEASDSPFPYEDVTAYLRRFIDEFGADRIMWASDCSQTRNRNTWAEALYCIKDSTIITPEEKAWILGGTVQKLLAWPQHVAPNGDSFDTYKPAAWREIPKLSSHAMMQDRRRR
jgi:L-fuconolactonase